MRNALRFACATAILVSLAPPASSKESATGTWSQGDVEKGGGRLLTRQVGEEVRFQLEVWRGAPSYNSGFLEGRLVIVGAKGTFRSGQPAGGCEIEFVFSASSALVKHANDPRNCGLGHGVYANGTYQRKSRKEPVFTVGDPRLGK